MSTVTVRDPMISVGRFRVLVRTDGRAFVYDPDAPPMQRTLGGKTFATTDEAVAFAKRQLTP